MCHVFRCDGLARHIANALRDICRRILAERSCRAAAAVAAPGAAANGGAPATGTGGGRPAVGGIARPNNLPNLSRVGGATADACRDDSAAAGEILTFESIYKSRLYAPRAAEFAHWIAPHLCQSCQTPSKAVIRAPNLTQLQSWDQLRNSDYFQNQSSRVDLRWVGRSDHALRHKRANEQRHTDKHQESNLVHFSLKMLPLVSIILVIFLIINWPNFVYLLLWSRIFIPSP